MKSHHHPPSIMPKNRAANIRGKKKPIIIRTKMPRIPSPILLVSFSVALKELYDYLYSF
jgi:hypothetical protein